MGLFEADGAICMSGRQLGSRCERNRVCDSEG